MAGASVWALATVRAQAAVLSYKANVTLTGTIVAEAIVAAGVDASLFTAVMSAPRIVTETKSILIHAVSGAVYPEFGQKAWTIRLVAAIFPSPVWVAGAISKRAYTMSAAICRTGIRQGAIGAVPSSVTSARAIETRSMI